MKFPRIQHESLNQVKATETGMGQNSNPGTEKENEKERRRGFVVCMKQGLKYGIYRVRVEHKNEKKN